VGKKGKTRITITVADPQNRIGLSAFDLTVTGPNEPPSISFEAPLLVVNPGGTARTLVRLDDAETPEAQLRLAWDPVQSSLLPNTRVELGTSIDGRWVQVLTPAGLIGTNRVWIQAQDPEGLVRRAELVVVSLSNTMPSIAPIPNQDVSEGDILIVPLLVKDSEFPQLLRVTWSASQPRFAPSDKPIVETAERGRELVLTALRGQLGEARVSVEVTDAHGASVRTSFVVQILPANAPPEISGFKDVVMREDETLVIPEFNVADVDGPFESLTLSAAAADASLVAPHGFKFGGTGFFRSLKIEPLPDAHGTTPVTITVRDRSKSASATFLLTITPVNDPPNLGPVAAQSLMAGEPHPPIPLEVRDIDSDSSRLSFKATSSNPLVLDGARVRVEGTSGQFQLDLSLAARAVGSSKVTLRVEDEGGGFADSTFDVEVRPRPVVQPEIRWIQPATEQTLTESSSLVLSVESTTPNGPLRSVEFFHNGVLLANVDAPPFQTTVTRLAEGKHEFAARAIDAVTNSVRVPAPLVVVKPSALPHDTFELRKPLSGASAIDRAANRIASRQAGEPSHAGRPGGKSIWWTWTASVTGPVTLNTQGSDVDTLLAVYRGQSLGELQPVAANDDDDSGLAGSSSRVTFQARAGETFAIAVDAFGGELGNYVISLSSSEPPGPPLAIELSGRSIVLSWTGPEAELVLEYSDSLSGSPWIPVSQPSIASENGRLMKLVLSGSNRFYRLRKVIPGSP